MNKINALIAALLLTCSGCNQVASNTTSNTTGAAQSSNQTMPTQAALGNQNASQPASITAIEGAGALSVSAAPEGEFLPPAKVNNPSANASVRKDYEEFQKDIAGCVSFIRVLEADKELMRSIRETSNPDAYAFDLLRKSRIRTTPEVQRILANGQYFWIGVASEGDPYAVAWVSDRDIYCAPTQERMKDAESLGESEEGWWMRSFFLTRAWASLPDPASVSGYGVESSYVEDLIKQAASIYKGSQRANFAEWINKTLEDVKRQRAKNEIDYKKEKTHDDGMDLDTENRVFNERIAFLTKFVTSK